jgi:hypothetical protein
MGILFKINEHGDIIRLYESTDEGKCWFNMNTHYRYLFNKGDLQKGKIYEAEDLNQIMKVKDYLRETLESGWITPEGDFWGCRSENHEAILEMFFNLDRLDAEQKGWIHVYPDGWYIGREARMTEAQTQALVNIGRHPLKKDIRNRDMDFRDAFPNGYPLAALPCGSFTLHRPETKHRKVDAHAVQPQLQTFSP